MTGKRHIIIDIPAPADFINSNQRIHRMQTAKLTKAWREAAAKAAQHVTTLTPPVHIYAHIWKPRGGRYDPGNLYPTAKACVDGLVDAGLLTDDDHTRVIGPDMRHGGKGNPQLILIIETPKETT
ncbi:hypothetical protein [Paenarthrobacter nicotinovorans]|uniref:hypothetical protein n=1 Tax=Paenarthrobacter nicotinovorans TaxID=29320 RepID=UPI0039A59F7B